MTAQTHIHSTPSRSRKLQKARGDSWDGVDYETAAAKAISAPTVLDEDEQQALINYIRSDNDFVDKTVRGCLAALIGILLLGNIIIAVRLLGDPSQLPYVPFVGSAKIDTPNGSKEMLFNGGVFVPTRRPLMQVQMSIVALHIAAYLMCTVVERWQLPPPSRAVCYACYAMIAFQLVASWVLAEYMPVASLCVTRIWWGAPAVLLAAVLSLTDDIREVNMGLIQLQERKYHFKAV